MPTVTLPETAAMKPAFHAPAEQLHQANVNYQDFNNDADLKFASDTLGFLFEGQRALNELRQNPSPLHTPAQHAKLVRERVDSYSRTAASKMDTSIQKLRSKERQLDSELAASANLKSVPHQFDAITATFHAMNASQKAQAMDGLIAQQDGPTISALIEAPSFVTGLEPEQRANLKSRIFQRANPEAFRLREQVGKALRKFDAASLPNIAGINALLAGTDRFDNATRHAEAVAQRTGFAA